MVIILSEISWMSYHYHAARVTFRHTLFQSILKAAVHLDPFGIEESPFSSCNNRASARSSLSTGDMADSLTEAAKTGYPLKRENFTKILKGLCEGSVDYVNDISGEPMPTPTRQTGSNPGASITPAFPLW